MRPTSPTWTPILSTILTSALRGTSRMIAGSLAIKSPENTGSARLVQVELAAAAAGKVGPDLVPRLSGSGGFIR